MNPRLEARLLQLAVGLGACVPVAAGFWGVLGGLAAQGNTAQSEARYLSGLLLGIGLAFWAMIPTLRRRGEAFRLLAAIVVVGGLARLWGATRTGLGPSVVLPLVMELGVTPALALWREQVERRARAAP